MKGTVFRAGKPQPGALVLLVQRESAYSPFQWKYDQSNSDGSFAWGNVAPGDYLIFTRLDGVSFDVYDEDFVRKLLPSGTPLHVDASTQDVRVEVTE